MKGDFSRWNPIPANNEQGVLYQQGRVFNDADLTAAERIAWHWRSEAARDVIGAGVAAVPATEASGFNILSAAVNGESVTLNIAPGRVWCDGVLLYLPSDAADPAAPVERQASYLNPPLNAVGTSTGSITDGTRDLVVLEVAIQEFNGFQDPARLIEPALGGPDTTERLIAGFQFQLLRLTEDEHCHNVKDRLTDGSHGKGKLTVKLQEPEDIPGDCPVASGGGYTGFEHNLYRIEIADVGGTAEAHFKWSSINGGLVGRGVFHHNGIRYVELQANRTAIINSGLIDYYLEALQYNDDIGAWQVIYGTSAHLNSGRDLELDHPPTFGSFPSTSGSVFFRLWNDIVPIASYTDALPQPFRDGIQLRFDSPAADVSYRPGDYWTFTVRAGGNVNATTLIDDQAPEGLILRRVPLAEIQWTGDQDTDVNGLIMDCRQRFLPLSRQKQCCTLTIGDGVSSFGDFNSLETAAAHLPPSGGELCLLPGKHFTNLVLTGRENIHIRGCENRTTLLPRAASPDAPVIHLIQGKDIRISGLDVFAPFAEAIRATGSIRQSLNGLRIEHCRMIAKTYVLYIHLAENVVVANNTLWLLDQEQGLSVISLRARQTLVERNSIGVWPFKFTPPGTDDDDGDQPDPNDDCLTFDDVFKNLVLIYTYLIFIWQNKVSSPPPQPYRAIGGIHLKGGCEHVRLLENRIDGGAGHGVVLGGLLPGEDEIRVSEDEDEPVIAINGNEFYAVITDEKDNRISNADMYLSNKGLVNASGVSDDSGLVGFNIRPGSYAVAMPGYRVASISQNTLDNTLINTFKLAPSDKLGSLDRASLYRISIQENSIERMALSGIGFAPFLKGQMEIDFPDNQDPAAVATFIALLLAPRDLVTSCNIVRELTIHGNHISGNLIAGFGEAMRRVVKRVGLGGISLAMVENVEITDNHIQQNGIDASRPSCGIFIGYGEDIEISRNQIHENGPLTADYEKERIQGIRGGIFVRLASALLVGGEYDRLQKPALSIRDNHIDQPAGRAITAFAYGPVNCVGNYLNSEREGYFTFMDNLVGTVLLLNLGGIHRQLSFASGIGKVDTVEFDNRRAVKSVDFQDIRRVEMLLPGGETLVNSNQIRFGPDHKGLISQFLFSLDDLGLDANQSSVFRPDLLFANVVAAGSSVRVTDNRFRERTLFCPYSLLSLAFGISGFAKFLTMNNTANNQGEHCIVAMSNAPASGLPVRDKHNLELTPFCRKIGDDNKGKLAYFWKALVAVLLARSTLFKTEDAAKEAVALGAIESYQGVENLQMNYQKRQGQEVFRLQSLYGEQRADVRLLKNRISRQAQAIEVLRLQRQLMQIPEVEAVEDEAGMVVDGRITNERFFGHNGLLVELVDADDKSLGVRAKSDDTGYFAMKIDAQTQKKLLESKRVFIRVLDSSGKELHRDKKALKIAANEQVRINVVLQRKPVVVGRARDVVFEADVKGSKQPKEALLLKNVPGISTKIVDILRESGIDSAENLITTPNIRLAELTGSFPTELKRVAETALKNPDLAKLKPVATNEKLKPKKAVKKTTKKKPQSDA